MFTMTNKPFKRSCLLLLLILFQFCLLLQPLLTVSAPRPNIEAKGLLTRAHIISVDRFGGGGGGHGGGGGGHGGGGHAGGADGNGGGGKGGKGNDNGARGAIIPLFGAGGMHHRDNNPRHKTNSASIIYVGGLIPLVAVLFALICLV